MATKKSIEYPSNHTERMDFIEGYEFHSQLCEDLVGVFDGKVYSYGEVYLYPEQINPRISQILLDEMIADELYYNGGYTKHCEKKDWAAIHENIWKVIRKNLWKQGHYGKISMKEAV